MNFPLYTLVQNLGSSKKADSSTKNNTKVPKMPQIIGIFWLYLCVTLNLKVYYESTFRITKN